MTALVCERFVYKNSVHPELCDRCHKQEDKHRAPNAVNDALIAPQQTKSFPDLNFFVVAKVDEYDVEFDIFDIEASGEDGKIVFCKVGATSHPAPVADIALAQRYLHGNVKWDGCSNWYFDEQDRCMLHGCSRRDILRYGEIVAACWDWTKELLPNFDGYRE